NEAPWFADDPVVSEGSGRPCVSPVGGDQTWDAWLTDHPEHREWAAERWLGAYRRLGAPPAALEETRRSLHRVATHVVAPARFRANGKIGLRWTRGGFGTPFFGDDRQVRVEGTRLVAGAEAAPLTSLAEAARLALDGPPDLGWVAALQLHDPPEPADPDEPLVVDADAAAWLADWFGLAWSVLEELRADPAAVEAGRVQLWPEHFDAAVDIGAGDTRASYGFSPGFAPGEAPYAYVSLWSPDAVPDDPRWNATTFRGAQLPLPSDRATVLGWLQDVLVSLSHRFGG
ncbi:MAG: hypothetical protein ACRD12_16915, partial [Acidimicrobiales bacterium]